MPRYSCAPLSLGRGAMPLLFALTVATACGPRTAPEPVAPVVDTAAAAANTVRPAGVAEFDFMFTRGEARLAGTLTIPEATVGRVPVALIVAGSGPTDRDGNNPPVLHTNMYAQLAWGLARHGIASVRYDKRGLGGSAMPLDPYHLTTDDFMEDVIAGAQALAEEARFSRVFLIGHSEGAQLALQAVNRGAPAAGVIMIGGVGRPLPVVIREQVARMLDERALVQFDSALARYLRGEPPGDVSPAIRPIFLPQNQRFLRSMAEYDASAELARAAVPVMIVHGGRDLQVANADAEALIAARPGAEALILPEANHTLKRTTETTPVGQLPTYRDPTLPLDPLLVPRLVAWMTKVGVGGGASEGRRAGDQLPAL